MKHVVFGSLVLLALVLAPEARAQQKPGGRVITLTEVTIVGRVQKPIASVDVNKIQPRLTLSELKQAFLDRISEAVNKEPF